MFCICLLVALNFTKMEYIIKTVIPMFAVTGYTVNIVNKTQHFAVKLGSIMTNVWSIV